MTNANESRDSMKISDPHTFFLVLAIFIAAIILYIIAVNEEGPQVNNTVTITTWIDTNADGIRDANERPLSNVCIWTGNSSTPNEIIQEELNNCTRQTDDKGIFISDLFLETYCNQLFAYAKPPNGYRNTTSYFVRGCKADFGYIQDISP